MEPHCLGKKTNPGSIGGDARISLEGVSWIERNSSFLLQSEHLHEAATDMLI